MGIRKGLKIDKGVSLLQLFIQSVCPKATSIFIVYNNFLKFSEFSLLIYKGSSRKIKMKSDMVTKIKELK